MTAPLRNLLRALGLVAVSAAPLYAAEGGEMPRIVNFVILFAILFALLRKPIASYLEARTQQIREQLADAAEKRARAEEQKKEADALLARLDDEVERAKREAQEAAEAERRRILRAAAEEGARIREIARKEIEAEVEAGRRRLLARAAELSVSLAHEKLRSSLTAEDQARLVDRSIEMLGESR